MYKAVFIDVDGTLIKKDHSISAATYDVIQKLKEKNILVILVSARPLSGIIPIAKKVNLADNPIASLNGAYIACDGEIIFNSVIDIEAVTKVYDQLQKYDATIIYYQQENWFSELENAGTAHEQKITHIPVTIQPFDAIIALWEKNKTGPNKILVIASEKATNEIQHVMKQKFINELSIATSKPTYLDVMNKQASKLNAIRLLMQKYNIQQHETIAIGDNFNDKEMIEFAGCGVAMGNAPVAVKEAANYVTDTNNNDGVCKAIKKLMNF
ncbi:MAG: Cof-type HAD-IIB family hydrolase [Ginsengibacter sp.]